MADIGWMHDHWNQRSGWQSGSNGSGSSCAGRHLAVGVSTARGKVGR
jgi:hypothetical protein